MKESATPHQSYIKPSVISELRKNKKLWTERDLKLHNEDSTYYPSKSVMIKRAVYDAIGENWRTK